MVTEKAKSRTEIPWSGYCYYNVGEGDHRNWDDFMKYSYISTGQGKAYSDSIKKLNKGDKFFAYFKGRGYVGFGDVVEDAVMTKDLKVNVDGQTVSIEEVSLSAPGFFANCDDSAKSEWAVKVSWKKIFPKDKAKTFTGAFANRNVVCKLRDQRTFEFLKEQFDIVED